MLADVIRYLMYGLCYGELERARSAFQKLPSDIRNQMSNIYYKQAERKCPHNLPIGRLMRKAAIELASSDPFVRIREISCLRISAI
jgi:hypothetical protein